MPEVTVEKKVELDLLPDTKPKPSATSDMPVVETKPDAQKAATDEVKKEDVSATPDSESSSAEPEAPKAKGVQKRLDELTRNWRDEQRARKRTEELLAESLETMKRLAEGRAPEAKTDSDDPEPTEPDVSKYTDQEKYNTDYRQYLRNLSRWEGRQAYKQEHKAQQQRESEARSKQTQEEGYRKMVSNYEVHVAKARAEIPDYDEIARDPTLPISKPMANAIMEAGELGPKMVVHLHQHRDEALRISQLSETGQLLELGKLAVKLSPTSAATSVSTAKPPIKPLSTGVASAPASGDEESMEAYAAKRQKQLAEERRPGGRR